MRKTELEELLLTVEQIRQEFHPNIPSAFLSAVVRAEESFPEDDQEAIRAIRTAVKVHFGMEENA